MRFPSFPSVSPINYICCGMLLAYHRYLGIVYSAYMCICCHSSTVSLRFHTKITLLNSLIFMLDATCRFSVPDMVISLFGSNMYVELIGWGRKLITPHPIADVKENHLKADANMCITYARTQLSRRTRIENVIDLQKTSITLTTAYTTPIKLSWYLGKPTKTYKYIWANYKTCNTTSSCKNWARGAFLGVC